MPFIHDDFLLHSAAARRLYHEHAEGQPILDYHNHLPPADLAVNRNFSNLADAWLGGDHYKWRAMRADGVDERLITGDAEPYDRFLAWARTVPKTLRNPLYHWTHLELKRYFGIDDLLNEATALEIWEEANHQLATPELSTHSILKRFNVAAICTTDDPRRRAGGAREDGRTRPQGVSGVPTGQGPSRGPARGVQRLDRSPRRGRRGADLDLRRLPGGASPPPRCLPRNRVDGSPTTAWTAVTPTSPPRARRRRSSGAPAPGSPRTPRTTGGSPRS